MLRPIPDQHCPSSRCQLLKTVGRQGLYKKQTHLQDDIKLSLAVSVGVTWQSLERETHKIAGTAATCQELCGQKQKARHVYKQVVVNLSCTKQLVDRVQCQGHNAVLLLVH